jgi:hypothetical protein
MLAQGVRLRRPYRPGDAVSAPGPGTRRRDLRRGLLRKRRGRFLLGVGGLASQRGPEGKEVEHAERLAAPVAPGNARTAVEVDHVFTVGAEIVGHVQAIGLIVQSSNRVWTP